jgi:6,7-dimethyl-8-ribityllumazine synthase
MNIGIVLGSFHKEEVGRMLARAQETATELDMNIVDEIWVPGSVEKPLAMKRLLERKDVDGIVVLGIIERGETEHGFTMGQSLMHFTMQLQLDHMKPIGLGVLGPGILPEQIDPRLEPYAEKAVRAVHHMYDA